MIRSSVDLSCHSSQVKLMLLCETSPLRSVIAPPCTSMAIFVVLRVQIRTEGICTTQAAMNHFYTRTNTNSSYFSRPWLPILTWVFVCFNNDRCIYYDRCGKQKFTHIVCMRCNVFPRFLIPRIETETTCIPYHYSSTELHPCVEHKYIMYMYDSTTNSNMKSTTPTTSKGLGLGLRLRSLFEL